MTFFPAAVRATLAGVAALFLLGCGNGRRGDRADEPPNMILFLVDDLGWNDVGYHGSDINTPRIDALVSEGIELDHFYTAPVCSPTRAGVLTGRYPIRFGLQRNVIRPWDGAGLPASETTLPEILASAGYRRRGIIGKWHLGMAKGEYHPLRSGFTSFYGQYSGGIDYFTHKVMRELDWHRDFETSNDTGYTTDLLAAEAIRFIEDAKGKGPFFLYLPFNAPHIPLGAKKEDLARYPSLQGSRRTYAAMVSSLDDAVGRILDTLDRLDLARSTVVVFASDNGGHHKVAASNAPLQGGKGSLHEGGIRVPAAIRWTGRIPAGEKVEAVTAYIDLLPTLLGLAGIDVPAGAALDGVDFSKVFTAAAPPPPRDFYSYFVGLGGRESMAIHSGGWKYLYIRPFAGSPNGNAKEERYLYRIDADPQERHNVIDEHPDLAAKLEKKVLDFVASRPEGGVSLEGSPPPGWKPPKEWRHP